MRREGVGAPYRSEAAMKNKITAFLNDERGAALIEYSILIGLIAVAVITAITAIGGWITTQWTTLNTNVNP